MPLWSAFCAGAYTARSINLDNEACINLYPQTIDSTGNAKKSVLYGTPGLIDAGCATTTSCRGMFSQDGRAFAVIGATLYELTVSGNGDSATVATVSRGTIVNDSKPVFFASNGAGGNQLAMSGGGQLKIFNLSTNTLGAAVSLPLTNAPTTVRFINSYFLLGELNTLKIWFSAPENGSSWNGLDFFTRSNTSDNVVGMEVKNDLIYVFGSQTSEIVYNVGAADNPFLPYPGSIIMDGAISAYAIGVVGESVVWLSKDNANVAKVMRMTAGAAEPISTPAVDFALASYSVLTDAEILIYEQEGHRFAIFTLPTADVSWAFDERESQWHQRLSWNAVSSTYFRWRARGSCAPGNQVILVGDYVTGDVYVLSLDNFTENGAAIRRLRRAPYLSAENQWLFLDAIELGIQGGVGNANVTDPQVNLRFSRDFGNTYTSFAAVSLGKSAVYNQRAIWRHLGRVRSDRLVMEIMQTDAARAVYGPGVWLRASPGSGEL